MVHHVTLSRYLLVFALVGAGCASHRSGAASVQTPSSNLAKGSGFAATLESSDERLKAALTLLAVMPTADVHRQVAMEYRRLGGGAPPPENKTPTHKKKNKNAE